MGDPRGFLKSKRDAFRYRPVCERVADYRDVALAADEGHSEEQSSRCMDCGTPFCHWACPIGNYIPEWNDLVFHGRWERAIELLHATNNFPEITGRLCPALCEYSCVLGINDDAVTIRDNELAVIEHAFAGGLIVPHPPAVRTTKRVAVIGSGPAGLAAADQLNKAGHTVTVFERDTNFGGILRYGIPDFKLEKSIIDRRLAILRQEGISFVGNTAVGSGLAVPDLMNSFDAVCIATGSRTPRDLAIEGRDLAGVSFAMDYLVRSNKRISGETHDIEEAYNARGKRVVVIGGGDTGADCVGTAHRQGARCVVQIEVLPKPPECRTRECSWPRYPLLLKTSTSHEEGGDRHWSILTKRFAGKEGRLTGISCARLESSARGLQEVPGSAFDIEADLAIIAIGFLHPEHGGLLGDLGCALDGKGNIKTDERYATSRAKVFAAGDARRGQSLVVWAIAEGRRAAHAIDEYLMGRSYLPVL